MLKLRPHWPYIFVVCFVAGLSMVSLAAPAELGEESKPAVPSIKVDDIFLQPTLRIYEPSQGGFNPLSWYFGIKTKFAPWADAQVSAGSSDLLFRPAWSVPSSDSVNLIDGKVTLHSAWGDFYAGQFLLPWGLEGTTPETQLWFPRSLVYENGAFPLRDEGAGFKTESDGYYMNVAVHNGEGADLPNYDNRVFVTGQWGYLGPAHTNIGISATAGRLSLPNVATDEHLRGANAYFGFNIFGLGLQIEGSYLETVTQLVTTDILAWHGDLELPITEHINGIGRYEQYYPNTRVGSNNLARAYLGAEIHSMNNISRLFVYFVKNYESQSEIPNDEIRVAWRITPPLE